MKLESLLLIRFHFDAERLPCIGIYFFYEGGENSGGYGRGSSSQLLLRQFPDSTWNNVEHLGQSNKYINKFQLNNNKNCFL